MENNFTTQLSDNGTARQIKAGYADQSDAIDPTTQARERMVKRQLAATADKWNRGVEATTGYVRQRPLVSVGLAAGIGVLLARLLKRH